MATLQINCKNQRLEWAENPDEIIAGNIKIDNITFSFCELWDGFTKTAVFARENKEAIFVLLNDDCICDIPPEVTEENGVLAVGVFGIKGEQRRTTEVLRMYFKEGVLTEGKPSEPTPDIYQQIVALCAEAVETANSVREDADNGKFNGGGGNGGTITVDAELSAASENPAQNKVITQNFNRINEKIKCLDGAYVFIGTYYELSKLPYYTSDVEEGITPVFNYQGEKIEFTQPYTGVPYLITVKDMGMEYCEDGKQRAYFSVPQNEGILFKPGMFLMMQMDNGEICTDTVYSVTCTPNYNNPMEHIANIFLQNTEIFNAGVSYVQCQPTATFRTGDNVAIIKVAGNVFYEVLSHDYGEEIEALQDEHQYLNEQIGNISTLLDEVIELQESYIGGEN